MGEGSRQYKESTVDGPSDMAPVVEKCSAVGSDDIWLYDRGTGFGLGQ